MEAITNGAEDLLIDALSFKLPNGASYVQERKSSTFWATGSNIYKSSDGVKVIRFQLNGDDNNWLDPSSVIVQFELKNESDDTNKKLRPVGGPHLFFKRLRVLAGSQVVEDIMDYGRTVELFKSLQNENVRDNDDIQSFGNRWDSSTVLNALPANQDDLLPQISAGKSKVVNFRPFCGLFHQSKYLPLKYMGNLILEFELCDTNDAIIEPRVYAVPYDAVFSAANCSNSWSIINACVKCDIATLDNSLNNEYTSFLLSGKGLSFTYSTYISQQNSLLNSGKTLSTQIIRAFSRLQRCFISFYSSNATGPYDKSTITFYHPNAEDAGTYNPDKEVQFQLQLGASLYPLYPCTNLSECFYHLKKSLNLPDFHQHSIGIKFENYRKNKFIFGFSFERVPDANWTGINTKAGQMLLIKLLGSSGISTADIATSMYSVLEAEMILEIRDIGITIYD